MPEKPGIWNQETTNRRLGSLDAVLFFIPDSCFLIPGFNRLQVSYTPQRMGPRKGLWLGLTLGLFALIAVGVLTVKLAKFVASKVRFFELSEVDSLAVSPNGSFVAAGHRDGRLTLWDPSTGKRTATLREDRTPIADLTVSSDGRYIAAGYRHGNGKGWVCLYDRTSNRWIARLGDCSFSPSVAFHPSRPILAWSTKDDSIGLWDVEAGREIRRLAPGKIRPSALAFSPDGRTLAIAALETKVFHPNSIAIWDIEGDKVVSELKGHGRWPEEVAFSPDGSELGSIGTGDSLIVWNLKTLQPVHRIVHATWMPSSLSFAPGRTTVFMALGDGSLTEYSLRDGAMVKDWTQRNAEGRGARSVRCDPKGRFVAYWSGSSVSFKPLGP